MATTTITIDDDVARALDDYRRQHGLPDDMAVVVQSYLERNLLGIGPILSRAKEPLRVSPAPRGSGLSDVSINHDHYLAEGLLERKIGRPR